MAFWGKPLGEVRKEDLQALVKDKVRERQTLEFKRDSFAKDDEGIRKMLRGVTAMANAYGGDILLGVETVGDGVASRIVGVPDGEREAQRIASSCLSNIEERVNGLGVWPVPTSRGRHIIMIHVPQSLRAPHMVTFKGLNQFWIRHDRQKSPMSIHEIRDACLRVQMLTTQVTEFLEKRFAGVTAFAGGRATLTLSLTPLLVAREDVINTKDQRLREVLQGYTRLNPGYMPWPCLTGLEEKRIPGQWLRLDRNGHFDLWKHIDEVIGSSPVDPMFRVLSAAAVKEYVSSFCELGRTIHEHCGVMQPLIAKLDLWNIKGVSLRGRGPHVTPGEPHTWSSDHLNLHPIEVGSSSESEHVPRMLLNRLWEAFGFDETPFG